MIWKIAKYYLSPFQVKYISLPDGSVVRAYVGEWKEWEKQVNKKYI